MLYGLLQLLMILCLFYLCYICKFFIGIEHKYRLKECHQVLESITHMNDGLRHYRNSCNELR